MASALQAIVCSDFLLDIDQLASDRDYRDVTSGWFESNGCSVDFSDCSIPTSSDTPTHSFEQMIEAAAAAVRSNASSLVITDPDAVEKWLPYAHPLSRRALSLSLGGGR